MVRVAIIGLGDIAKIHIQAIQNNKNAQLVAVCDIDSTHANDVSQTTFYTDYNEMLEKESLDCIHICLPHYLHYPVTKACVEAGVNVFQEKPVALDYKEAVKLVELEEQNPDIKICICLQNRLNETFEALIEMINSKKYGDVTGIKGIVTWYRPKQYYDVKPWRGKMAYAGGGAMINQSIHTLDLMQLIGGKVSAIKGHIDNLIDFDIEVEDTAIANIDFENGVRGLYYATTTYTANSSVEFEVLTEQARFNIKDSILTLIDEAGEEIKVIEDTKMLGTKFYYGASHAKLINYFYNVLETGSEDYIHVKDAIPSIHMIDMIRTSSKLNKKIKG